MKIFKEIAASAALAALVLSGCTYNDYYTEEVLEKTDTDNKNSSEETKGKVKDDELVVPNPNSAITLSLSDDNSISDVQAQFIVEFEGFNEEIKVVRIVDENGKEPDVFKGGVLLYEMPLKQSGDNIEVDAETAGKKYAKILKIPRGNEDRKGLYVYAEGILSNSFTVIRAGAGLSKGEQVLDSVEPTVKQKWMITCNLLLEQIYSLYDDIVKLQDDYSNEKKDYENRMSELKGKVSELSEKNSALAEDYQNVSDELEKLLSDMKAPKLVLTEFTDEEYAQYKDWSGDELQKYEFLYKVGFRNFSYDKDYILISDIYDFQVFGGKINPFTFINGNSTDMPKAAIKLPPKMDNPSDKPSTKSSIPENGVPLCNTGFLRTPYIRLPRPASEVSVTFSADDYVSEEIALKPVLFVLESADIKTRERLNPLLSVKCRFMNVNEKAYGVPCVDLIFYDSYGEPVGDAKRDAGDVIPLSSENTFECENCWVMPVGFIGEGRTVSSGKIIYINVDGTTEIHNIPVEIDLNSSQDDLM